MLLLLMLFLLITLLWLLSDETNPPKLPFSNPQTSSGLGVLSCSPVVSLLLLMPSGQASVATMNILQDDHWWGGGDGDMLSTLSVGLHPTSPNTPLIVGFVEVACGDLDGCRFQVRLFQLQSKLLIGWNSDCSKWSGCWYWFWCCCWLLLVVVNQGFSQGAAFAFDSGCLCHFDREMCSPLSFIEILKA